jgi:N-acetylglucosamine-6-sulfatase
MPRIPVAAIAAVLLLACGTPRDAAAPDAAAARDRPNILVVLIDDLRFDEIGAAGHPYVETPSIDRLAAEGAMFTSAFHVVSLCSPNRASILTGQYPTRHGIIDNVARDLLSHRLETFPRTLQASGYETGFIGKWHMGNDPTPRPGFDSWVSFPGQGQLFDPQLWEDGGLHEVPGYITDILTDRALAFVDREHDRPFFLFLAHKAVHPEAVQRDDGSVDPAVPPDYTPAPRHEGRYAGRTFPRRPNTLTRPEELRGKPALRRALAGKFSAENVAAFGAQLEPTSEETIRRRAEMMLSIDEGLGRILEALEKRGILDRTFVLFTSDNGYFFGEHGLSVERRLPYEESIRSPLLIRYPPLAPAGSKIDGLVASIDVAPTVLDVAGAPIGANVQGRSLLPLLRGDGRNRRQSLFIEFYTYDNPFPWLADMDYRAIRTDRYKYVHWVHYPGEGELYDLAVDPFEMENRIADPALAGVLRDLRARMADAAVEALGLRR